MEGRSIEALFQLNVKGETANLTLNTSRLSGIITAEAGGTAGEFYLIIVTCTEKNVKCRA